MLQAAFLDIKKYQVQHETIYYPTIDTVMLTRLMYLLHATGRLLCLLFVCSSDTYMLLLSLKYLHNKGTFVFTGILKQFMK